MRPPGREQARQGGGGVGHAVNWAAAGGVTSGCAPLPSRLTTCG